MINSLVAISIGASAGAILRWLLASWFNGFYFLIPLGTLAANLIGGYLIGVALAVFAQQPGLPPEWRLLVITGFLGGLTTFSTFSAEVAALIQQQRLGYAMGAISAHVVGSLLMTFAGLATVAALRKVA